MNQNLKIAVKYYLGLSPDNYSDVRIHGANKPKTIAIFP